ncbi:hypothetical protein FH972_005355 [Carpinus fangiana]|uniref:Pectinesterase inhibitor domain-containing protein n=1 Tax=Carpinus fangiana TaxID=176857 RepID=A0A5N6QPD5_9ROSI|nr:hypothetical protein FH972_005355 [Carpinus fangiana]
MKFTTTIEVVEILNIFCLFFPVAKGCAESVNRLLYKVKIKLSASSNASNLQEFSYTTIKAATQNFSCENKLGEGGYGPVYKVASTLFCVEAFPPLSSP